LERPEIQPIVVESRIQTLGFPLVRQILQRGAGQRHDPVDDRSQSGTPSGWPQLLPDDWPGKTALTGSDAVRISDDKYSKTII